MPKAASIRKLITTYPLAVGVLLATILAGTIFMIVAWFPRISDTWDRHEKTVRSIWCTVALIVVCLYRLRHWRHRRGFWLTLSAFLMLHILGVFLYSIYVHPLLMQEWVLLLLLEALVIVLFLGWVLQRLSRQGGHRCRSLGSDQ